MIQITSTIMTGSPDRSGWVNGIKDQMPDAEVVVDYARRGVWVTARRCWRKGLGAGGTHHLVMQDDIVLSPNFAAGIRNAVEARPNSPLTFFCVGKAMRQAYEAGHTWARTYGPWGQAILMPRAMVGKFLRWECHHVRPEIKWDDYRVALFCAKNDIECWATVPSLVEHAGHQSSIVGNNSKIIKRDGTVIAEDAGAIDFTGIPEDPYTVVSKSKYSDRAVAKDLICRK